MTKSQLIVLLSVVIFFNYIPGFNAQIIPSEELRHFDRITHYSRDDFKADPQFWTMTRDDEGVLYFGNNDGALVFDGERWQKVYLPNNSSVRSLTTSNNGKVYAGGYNEIGVIEKDAFGKYSYRSYLEDLKLENENLENLWQVHEFQGYIIYRSFKKLIVLSDGSATQISSNQSFIFSGVVDGKFLVQDAEHGVFSFDPHRKSLALEFSNKDLDNVEIVGFLNGKKPQEILIAGKNGAIFKADSQKKKIQPWKILIEKGKEDQIISSLKKDNTYYFGTLNSSILAMNEEGRLENAIAPGAEVSNSSVLNLYSAGENLWALLNNGLDFIELDSPVSKIFGEASIYDVLVENNNIYLATNKGVYISPITFSKQKFGGFKFKKVSNLEGQAWSIQKEKGSIIVGHDKGLYYIEDGVAKPIGSTSGFWKILSIPEEPNLYLASNYNGLYLLKWENGSWELQEKVKGFDESSRDIIKAKEKNTFWVCHGYKGVYKLKFTDDYSRVYALEHYTDQNGFSSPYNINVTTWKDEIIFTTNTGFYKFQNDAHRFVPYEPLNQILDSTYNTRKLIQEKDRAWFVQDDEVGYFKTNEQHPELHKNLFLNLKGNLNRGMESIYPLSINRVLIGATNGLYAYDLRTKTRDKKISTHVSKISAMEGGNQRSFPVISTGQFELPSKTEILRFEFSAPEMSPASTVQYQYILEGIDKKWSSWYETAYKEYTHLGAGDYVFKVRSRDLKGKKGEIAEFGFTIPPVWYQTYSAIIVYILLFCACCTGLYYFVRRKIQQEQIKSQLQAEKTNKLLELEIEQLKLEQEKENIRQDKEILEEENIRKSKELANYTMLLVQKKEVFSDTYDSLKDLRKTLRTQSARKQLQEIIQRLRSHHIGEEYMNIFDVNFEKVHQNFFKYLLQIDPKLTKRELRLCAFVKLNLSNKEIAPLLNISVRGVETARYRVRKKLGVQEANFTEFLENLTSEEAKPLVEND